MNIRFFYAMMLMPVLLSCSKRMSDTEDYRQETASLEIILSSEPTKASGEGGDEETAVSDYQILVYDMSTRMLEAHHSPDPDSFSVNMQCSTGSKEVIVLANAPDVSGIVSYDDFLTTRSRLADNSAGHLVMEGRASLTLTASGGSVKVDIKRIVSKIVLEAVTVDFAPDAYDRMDFVLKKVYLTNVAGDKTYLAVAADPSQWYSQIERAAPTEVDMLIYDEIGNVNLKGSGTYGTRHHFYCYPNPYVNDSFDPDQWSPRPTRLVIEAALGNTPCYYPVSLPELKQNTRYHVSLHITRPGAPSPEQDMDKYAATFNIHIEEWKGPENVTETI